MDNGVLVSDIAAGSEMKGDILYRPFGFALSLNDKIDESRALPKQSGSGRIEVHGGGANVGRRDGLTFIGAAASVLPVQLMKTDTACIGNKISLISVLCIYAG